MKLGINQVVKVELGSTVPGSPKGEPRWVLGTITSVSPRSGEMGNLCTVNIHPEKEAGASLVKRYDGASRLVPGDMADAQELSERRASVAASLTTQISGSGVHKDPQPQNIPKADNLLAKADKVTSISLRGRPNEPFNNLGDAVLVALFQHPQVRQYASEVCDAAVRSVQATADAFSESLDLTRTSLKACDTERRAALVRVNQLETDLRTIKLAASKITPEAILAKAGKERGFILWNPKSSKPPQVKYSTLSEAERVRRLMADRCPGETFHICAIGQGERTVVSRKQELV